MKHEAEIDLGTGIEFDVADPITLEWEKSLADEILNHSAEDITLFANVGRRYSRDPVK